MLFSEDCYLDVKSIHIAHEFVIDKAHKCEYPHGRASYGLIYTLHGNAEYRFLNGERVRVCAGDVIFLSPNAAYSIVTESEFRHFTVNFDIHKASSRLGILDKTYLVLKEKNTEHIERGFRKLVSSWRLKKSGYEMQSVSTLYELIAQFYSDCQNEQSEQYERLLAAKEHIEQNFNSPITLEELAFLSNMSVTNFRREWKKQYPDSPIQYRDSIRLYYSKEYLACGYYTVSEIAEKCGFDDVSYFVRFFRKHTGITPGQFKKQYLKK